MSEKLVSDGSTASYYELPKNCAELQDLISHRNMNSQIGEIFRACYRYGQAAHSDMLRDAKKIKFYAEAEIRRLEAGRAKESEPTKISVSSIEGAPSLGHRMHPGIREALNQLIVRAYTSESEQSLPSRRDRLERLLTYQGLTISQIIAALSREGYSSEGVIKELEWLVTHGVAYYNPTGAVWCRAKL